MSATHPLALALLVALPTLATAQKTTQTSDRALLEAPFSVVADHGERTFTELAIRNDAYEQFSRAHATDRPSQLRDLALPGGERVDLRLRPFSVLEEGATARVVTASGEEVRMTPSLRAFSVAVPGRASRGFLAVTAKAVNGYLTLDGETFILSTGGVQDGPLAITHDSYLGGAPVANWCGTQPSSVDSPSQPPIERSSAVLGQTTMRADVFIECDDQFRGLFADDQEAIDYATLLVSATSTIYRRDLAVTMRIPDGYIRVWNTTPPWGNISSFGNISDVQDWWTSGANPDKGTKRAAVHVLTWPVFGGVASTVDGVCINTSAYEISSVYGSFPFPTQHTSSSNWDLEVVAHEFGHTFGSDHTFDYIPPISCYDNSGPDSGTIMSYCHLEPGGVNNIGMRFHERVQDDMLQTLPEKGCLKEQNFDLGDYDDDGDIDANDVAELDSYLNQGFASRGAEAAFDMNDDGVVDTVDSLILDAMASGQPAASAITRQGNNTLCYINLAPPILGTTWSTLVSGTAGSLTYILGYDQPANIPTAFGDQLVLTTNLGGNFLFSSVVTASGFGAFHETVLPLDPSLAGLVMYSQGVILDTSVTLCNAVDVTLSFY